MSVVILDEVTFLIKLIQAKWDAASLVLHANGGLLLQKREGE